MFTKHTDDQIKQRDGESSSEFAYRAEKQARNQLHRLEDLLTTLDDRLRAFLGFNAPVCSISDEAVVCVMLAQQAFDACVNAYSADMLVRSQQATGNMMRAALAVCMKPTMDEARAAAEDMIKVFQPEVDIEALKRKAE